MSEASGVHNFWHLSAKILYTVEPKTATSTCVHFEVATSPTKKKPSLLHVSILSRFEIVDIIGPSTWEIILSAILLGLQIISGAFKGHLLLGLFFYLLLANIGPGPCVTPFKLITTTAVCAEIYFSINWFLIYLLNYNISINW